MSRYIAIVTGCYLLGGALLSGALVLSMVAGRRIRLREIPALWSWAAFAVVAAAYLTSLADRA